MSAVLSAAELNEDQAPVLEVELSLTSAAFRNEKDRTARRQFDLRTRFIGYLMTVSFLVNEHAPVVGDRSVLQLERFKINMTNLPPK